MHEHSVLGAETKNKDRKKGKKSREKEEEEEEEEEWVEAPQKVIEVTPKTEAGADHLLSQNTAEEMQLEQPVESAETYMEGEMYHDSETWEAEGTAVQAEAEWYDSSDYATGGYYYQENVEADQFYGATQEQHGEYYDQEGEEQQYEGQYSEQYQWSEEYYQQYPEGEGEGVACGDGTEWKAEGDDAAAGELAFYEQGAEEQDYSAAGYEGGEGDQEYWENAGNEQYYEGQELAEHQEEYSEGDINMHYGYEPEDQQYFGNENIEQPYSDPYVAEQPMGTAHAFYHDESAFPSEYNRLGAEEELQQIEEEKLMEEQFSPNQAVPESKPLRSILKKPKQKFPKLPISQQQQQIPQNKPADTPGQTDPSLPPKNDIGAEYVTSTTDGHRVQFYCQLCKCHFNTATAKNLHLKGMSHIEMFIRTKANLLSEVITTVQASPKV